MPAKKSKMPEYTRRAIENYRKTHKTLQIMFSFDELDRMKAAGMTTKDIKPLVMTELERRERLNATPAGNQDQPQKDPAASGADPLSDFVPPFD